MLSSDVFDFVIENPDNDVYLFNPFPTLVYYFMNVWQQGEFYHPKLNFLAQHLFGAASINYDVNKVHRHSIDKTVYCNYWVAKKSFFDGFLPFIKKMDQTLESMNPELKSQFFLEAKYDGVPSCFYPFIFERFISSYLSMSDQFSVKPYVYQKNNHILHLGRVERAFFRENGVDLFYNWEKTRTLAEIENAINRLNLLLNPDLVTDLPYFLHRPLRSFLKIRNSFLVKRMLRNEFS